MLNICKYIDFTRNKTPSHLKTQNHAPGDPIDINHHTVTTNTKLSFRLNPATENLDGLYNEWTTLLKSIPDASFYHQPEWFYSRLQAYHDQKTRIWFVTAYHENTLIGVFPLTYVKLRRFGLSLNCWVLYWVNDMQLNDFIYSPTHAPDNILDQLIEFLNEQKTMPWDLFALHDIPTNAVASKTIYSNQPARCVSVYDHDSKYISCDNNYEDSVKHISTKFKRNLRRSLKKLNKKGTTHYEYADSADDLEKAYSQFVNTEAENYKGKLHTALKFDLKQFHFYQKIIKAFGSTGRCSIHSLWLNNEMIAAQLAIKINTTYHMMKIGYSYQHHDVGPGNLLLNETIRHYSNNNDINNISFVTGFSWNDHWSPHVTHVFHHYIYSTSLKGQYFFITEKLMSVLRYVKYKFFLRQELIQFRN